MKAQIDIDYVSKLARLKLDPSEREMFARHLDSILGYMEKLNQLDTSQVEPTQHILPLQNVTRADEVKPSIEPATVLKHAPAARNQFFIVPQVIE